MATYIVEVKEIDGNRIGFGYFDFTVNCFVRPFADSKRGLAGEVFSEEGYMIIIETIYITENWGDVDHKIDSAQFLVFRKFMEEKALEKGVKVDLVEWDYETTDFFLKIAHAKSLAFSEAVADFVTLAYRKWKEQGNSLASPLFKSRNAIIPG